MFDWVFKRSKPANAPTPFLTEHAPDPEVGQLKALPGWFSTLTGNGTAIFGPTRSPRTLIQNYEQTAPLYSAVNRLASSVASLPFRLTRKDTGESLTSHPALDLLNSPNTTTEKTRQDFVRNFHIWKILTGNAYPLLTGRASRPPLEMYLLNPLYLEIDPNQATGFPETLRYQPYSGTGVSDSSSPSPTNTGTSATPATAQSRITFTFDIDQGVYYPKEQTRSARIQTLYHFMNFNANYQADCMMGSSEITAVYFAINHYLMTSGHNLALLDNGARPSGAFTMKSRDGQPASLTPTQYERIQQQIAASYTGAKNAGKPLLLEGGLEFVPLSMTPRDLDFLSLKREAEEAIYKALGIPVQLLMANDVTANNLTNFRLEFYENRVLPLGDEFCEYLNRMMLSRYPDSTGLHFTIDRDEIDVLSPQRIEKRKAIEQSLILTIDEKRRLYQMPPIKYGDKIVDPNGRPIAGNDVDAAELVGAQESPNDTTPSVTLEEYENTSSEPEETSKE